MAVKKYYKKSNGIIAFFAYLLFIPFALVCFVGILVGSPVELVIYLSSDYRKEVKKRYHILITIEKDYKLFRQLRKKRIDFGTLKVGNTVCFKYREKVFVPPYFSSHSYDTAEKKWYSLAENRDFVFPLDQIIREDFSDIADKAVFLVKSDEFEKQDLTLAQNFEKFAVFSKDCELSDAVLKKTV